jgi:hypothetical protein
VIKFTIDRTKWDRGSGVGRLWNSKEDCGCFLGHIALQCGISKAFITNQASPIDAPSGEIMEYPVWRTNPQWQEEVSKYPDFLVDKTLGVTSICWTAMEVNDDPTLTDERREEKLRNLLILNDCLLTFTN